MTLKSRALKHNTAMDKETIERLRKRASQHFLDSIAVKQEAEKNLDKCRLEFVD